MSEKTSFQKAHMKASEDLEGFSVAAENVVLKRRIRELEDRLAAIANYPDPDFPADDAEDEAKRAWQILYTLKNMASLQGESDE